MRKKVLKLVEKYLQFLARWKIRRAKPKIVAITGSYGKTSTKEAIFHLLSKKFGSDVGKNWGNMNTEIGLPLAVLGLRSYSFGAGLIWDIIRAKWNFCFYRLPKILVLELGVDKPGDMEFLLKIITPDVALLTGISETHLEKLKDIEGVKKEKVKMLEALGKGGVAIINADDENSKDLHTGPTSSRLSGAGKNVKMITFGKNGDISYSNLEVNAGGTSFDLKIGADLLKINSKLIGEHSIYILLAAAAVANEFSIGTSEIKKGLEEIGPQKGRMNLIKVKNEILVLDDSYNSNPQSVTEALKTLSAIKSSGRKVAILGNMNELGGYTEKAHLQIGEEVGKVVDFLIAVGDNGGYLASGAEKSGLAKNQIATFKTTEEVLPKLDNLLSAGDLILVKASQNKMRFERIVKTLLDDPVLAKKLLVRQDKKWGNR